MQIVGEGGYALPQLMEEEEEWERMMEAVDREWENDEKWMGMIQES